MNERLEERLRRLRPVSPAVDMRAVWMEMGRVEGRNEIGRSVWRHPGWSWATGVTSLVATVAVCMVAVGRTESAGVVERPRSIAGPTTSVDDRDESPEIAASPIEPPDGASSIDERWWPRWSPLDRTVGAIEATLPIRNEGFVGWRSASFRNAGPPTTRGKDDESFDMNEFRTPSGLIGAGRNRHQAVEQGDWL